MLVSEKIIQFDSEIIKNLDASNGGISSAKKQWGEILNNASNPYLKTILYIDSEESNLLKDNIKSTPPCSLPGKLLAFLFQRFKYFNGEPDKGVSIVSDKPTNNGETLEAIILELAHLNNLNPKFLDWIENSNSFI